MNSKDSKLLFLFIILDEKYTTTKMSAQPPYPAMGYGQVSNQAYPSSSLQQSGYPPQQSMYPAHGSLSNSCTSKIELKFTCKNLINQDVTSKSDPMVSVQIKQNNKWCEIGRTENIKNNLNPEFCRSVQLDYFFEEVQHIKLSVYDIDNSSPSLNDDDFLGKAEFTVGEIVSSKSASKYLTLNDGSKAGNSQIIVTAEEIDNTSNDLLILKFSAKELDNKDFFGKSDPFLEIKRILPNGTLQLCHRTEQIKNNLNPVWREFQIPKRALCGQNIEQEIKILCYDYDDDGSHDFIGECSTSVLQLTENSSISLNWQLINPKKLAKKGKSYKGSGKLMCSCKVIKVYSFLEFIMSGTQINFIVAVDFTLSNGDPRDPRSLHHINPNYPNEYMQAIRSIGSVLQDYDSDKMYPALGFGALIPPEYFVSHEFALNFNFSNPFCSGVDGLLDAYTNCLQTIKLSGPTNFSPVINHAMKFAHHAHLQSQPDNYFVLLILTDGIITDIHETRNAIVKASSLPLSIIIIGVGGTDFEGMNILDGDGQRLKDTNGKPASRDIVQFVPFRKYQNANPIMLSKELLAEIPSQFGEYYKSRNMVPKPKLT